MVNQVQGQQFGQLNSQFKTNSLLSLDFGDSSRHQTNNLGQVQQPAPK